MCVCECIKVGKTRVVSVEYGGQNVLNIEGHSAQNISFIINNDSAISLGIRSGPPKSHRETLFLNMKKV